MPSQQEVRWSELKVGVLVLLALITLTVLILLMSGSVGGIFTPKIVLRSYFENAAGVKVGAPVNLDGVAIGAVTAVQVVPDPSRKLTPVEVMMKVSSKFRPGLHKDSQTSLSTVGVLGDTVVDINSKLATGPLVQNGDELPTTETPSLQDVIKASQGTIEQVNVILAKLNTIADTLVNGKGSIGLLLNDPSLYNRANATVSELQGVIDDIAKGKGSVGKLVSSDDLYNKLNDTASRLDNISKEIDSGQGSVGKLLKDPTLYNNANQAIASVNNLMTEANQGKGALGLLTKNQQFADRLNDTITKLNDLVTQIDTGNGTVAQLVRNPSIYNNADQMLTETRTLITSIRENPKKYLTFHVKVF